MFISITKPYEEGKFFKGVANYNQAEKEILTLVHTASENGLHSKIFRRNKLILGCIIDSVIIYRLEKERRE